MRVTLIKRRKVRVNSTVDLRATRQAGFDNLLDLIIEAHDRLAYEQIEQFFLGGDVIVKGGLLNTNFRSNVARCGGMIALFIKHLRCRGNDLLLTLRHAPLLCRPAASATRTRQRCDARSAQHTCYISEHGQFAKASM